MENKLQKILSKVRRAVDDYGMINNGDRIAVGISGGKDSLTLLYALEELRRFYPAHFDVIGVSVSLTGSAGLASLEALFVRCWKHLLDKRHIRMGRITTL